MKDSGVEWIGKIPESWEVVKSKYVVDLYTGNSIKDEEKYLYTNEVNADLYVSSKNIDSSNGKLILDDVLWVKKDDLSFVRAFRDDILICIEGGSAGRKKTLLDRTVTFVNKLCCFHSIGINSKYLYFVMQSPHYINEFNSNISGMIGGVTKARLNNFMLPTPPLETQNRIANFLNQKSSEIDALIDIENKQVEKLKEYKQAVITEAVTKGLDKNVPMKDSGVEWSGEIPEGWKVQPLKSLFSFDHGLNITKDDLKDEGECVISYGQIHSKTNTGTNISEDLIRYIDKKTIDESEITSLSKGDFIFADTSEDLEGCGNAVYINDSTQKIYAGYHTVSVKSKIERNNKYYAYLFKTNIWREQIRKNVNAVKVFSISKKVLSKCSILIPEFNTQYQIIDYLDKKCSEIDRLIEIKKQKIGKLEEYKKSLIYEYVTGKKEVK